MARDVACSVYPEGLRENGLSMPSDKKIETQKPVKGLVRVALEAAWEN
jgi:hypothetical protein